MMSALGEFQQLVKSLLEVAEDQKRRRRTAFLGGACPLLLSARQCRREATLDELRDWLTTAPLWQSFRALWPSPSLLDARCQVIAASGAGLEESLTRAIREYSDAWGYTVMPFVENAAMRAIGEPDFLHLLPAGDDIELFRRLAAPGRSGPWHPALLLVGDTYAWLYDDSDVPADETQSAGSGQRRFSPDVATCVLLAGDDNQGYAGRLELQRVPGGCGALYPDPLSCGYQRTNTEFQQGLQNAWWAVIGRKLPGDPIDFDIRWRLWVTDKTAGVPLEAMIGGHSAEAAVSCALLALRRDEPLDTKMAVTARFKQPGTANLRLAPVSEVAVKLLSAEWIADLRERHVELQEVFVHSDQKVAGEKIAPRKFFGDQLQVTGIADLEQAYAGLSHWANLTVQVKQKLGQRAKQDMLKACEGEYIRSHFRARRSNEGSPGRASAAGMLDEWGGLLSDAQVNQLETGDYGRRVLIIGNSGMGKSTFLIHCQQQIAEAANGRVPVLLTNLSRYLWDQPEELLSQLAAQFRDWVPQKELDAWFAWMLRSGRLVLLLDALDQTNERLDALHAWLTVTGGVSSCPIVMTGRPLVERGDKGHVLAGQEWSVLRVETFDPRQQREYLGDDLYERLLMQQGDSIESRRRKLQWWSLMGTPLLLKLIRDRAAKGGLEGLANRFCIYREAVTELLGKGLESARRAKLTLGKLARQGQPELLLGRIAWQMVQGGNFQQVCSGDDFQYLCDMLELDEYLDVLDQLNVIRLEVDAKGFRAGLEWRHLSFCEYFAGVHLAAKLEAGQLETAIEQALRLPLPEKGETYDDVKRGVAGFVAPEQWEPVLGFALSYLQQQGNVDRLNRLVNHLLGCGGVRPVRDFLIAESDRNRPQPDAPLREFCLFLGGYSLHFKRDVLPLRANRSGDESSLDEAFRLYRELVQDVQVANVTLDSPTLAIIERMFERREYRGTEYLAAAWELLEARASESSEATACRQRIHQRFCGERAVLHAKLPALHSFFKTFRPCPARPDESCTFTMGEAGQADEPEREVTVQPFSMADFPVTNALFEAFDPSHVWERDLWSRADDQPAVWVNWHQAKLFCLWLTGDGPVHYRLPTEEEWEFACRASSTTQYWWGPEPDPQRFNGEDRLGRTNGRHDPEVDIELHKNGWALYDVLGNVWEWCEDGPIFSEEVMTALRQELGLVSFRLLRGGAFHNDTADCRSASRSYLDPVPRNFVVGFRLVR